jgi:hypothetical protein
MAAASSSPLRTHLVSSIYDTMRGEIVRARISSARLFGYAGCGTGACGGQIRHALNGGGRIERRSMHAVTKGSAKRPSACWDVYQ